MRHRTTHSHYHVLGHRPGRTLRLTVTVIPKDLNKKKRKRRRKRERGCKKREGAVWIRKVRWRSDEKCRAVASERPRPGEIHAPGGEDTAATDAPARRSSTRRGRRAISYGEPVAGGRGCFSSRGPSWGPPAFPVLRQREREPICDLLQRPGRKPYG
jgi:hypothetical protein